MRRMIAALACLLAAGLCPSSAVAQDAPYQREARQIFARLIAFHSSAGQRQVPPMIDYIVQTLRAAGVPAEDIVVIPHEETAALLVRVPGRDPSARPILFSSHLDVVEARREDWERDPFQLVEENGFFFGRGVEDDKFGDTAMISTMLRMRAAHFRPRRTLVFAFIGDEETTFATTRLVAAHPWVRRAEYALNTDAVSGILAPDGRPILYIVNSGEKTYATFRVTARNPGGHSSLPRPDNAIYDLSRALLRVADYSFPATSNPVQLQYLAALGRATPGEAGQAFIRFAANPADAQAVAVLRRIPDFAAAIATTCVPTMLSAGHAENALPQRAEALVNCRIFPDEPIAAVRDALVRIIANPEITVELTAEPEISPISQPRADVMAAIERSIHRLHPGVPIASNIETGGSDGLIYRHAGIPTYATAGTFIRPEDIYAHGLNERIPVASFYESLDHLHDLAVTLGGR